MQDSRNYLSRLSNYESSFPASSSKDLLSPEAELARIKQIIAPAKPVELYSSRAIVNTITSEYEPIIDRDLIKAEQDKDDFCKHICQLSTVIS